MVTDIQGVGTFYTDPQIHTLDGTGFGAGNLGEDGINRFLRTHQHTLLCEQLGLPSPNAGLSDAELAAKLQADEAEIAREDEAAARGGADEDEDEDEDEDDLADVIAQIQAAELAEREGRPWVQG